MTLTPAGRDDTFTREELLRLRNMLDTNDTDLSEETSDRNEQVSDSDESED